MEFLHTIDPLYVLSGVLVGGLVGMTGVGGGSLMTPILILVFGIHPATAVGTDLLYASITKTGGTFVHGYHRTIDWRVVGRLAMGSVPATALTILALYELNVSSTHDADRSSPTCWASRCSYRAVADLPQDADALLRVDGSANSIRIWCAI